MKISKTSIYATIPIILSGIAWSLNITNFQKYVSDIATQIYLYNIIFVSAWLSWFILFLIGWIKNFPKWSIHSISFCIIMSLLLINVRSPSLGRNEEWGLLALVPLILSLLIGITIKGYKQPLSKLAQQLNTNNSRILFIFYGILPFINAALFDEIVDKMVIPLYIFIMLIIIICILIYLNAINKKLRNWSLIFGFLGTIIIALLTSPYLDKYQI